MWQGLDGSSFGNDFTLPRWREDRFFGRKAREPWRGASNLRCDMVGGTREARWTTTVVLHRVDVAADETIKAGEV